MQQLQIELEPCSRCQDAIYTIWDGKQLVDVEPDAVREGQRIYFNIHKCSSSELEECER